MGRSLGKCNASKLSCRYFKCTVIISTWGLDDAKGCAPPGDKIRTLDRANAEKADLAGSRSRAAAAVTSLVAASHRSTDPRLGNVRCLEIPQPELQRRLQAPRIGRHGFGFHNRIRKGLDDAERFFSIEPGKIGPGKSQGLIAALDLAGVSPREGFLDAVLEINQANRRVALFLHRRAIRGRQVGMLQQGLNMVVEIPQFTGLRAGDRAISREVGLERRLGV